MDILTGTALALACAARGYRIRIVTSEAFSQEKRDHMAALGAELTLVPSEGGLTTKRSSGALAPVPVRRYCERSELRREGLMSANRATILALTAVVALAGQPLQGQASRRGGGGHPGGGGRPGGHPGGSHAVPRGGAPAHPGYSPRGGVAVARHPRAGTGSSHYYPRYGHSPPYGHHRPYYGAPYYGYYRPYPYFSSYFGWPYSYSTGWWPYGYYSPSYHVSYYGHREEAPRALAANGDTGRVRLEVRPEDASVYVDEEFWGNARETKYLTLRPGRHSIELVRPGFEVARREVDVVRGETADVLVELRQP